MFLLNTLIAAKFKINVDVLGNGNVSVRQKLISWQYLNNLYKGGDLLFSTSLLNWKCFE